MTGDGAIGPDDDMLVAEYVLGVLPHGERVALAQRLEVDDGLARRLRFWEERLAPLGASIEPVTPSASVLAALERRLFPQAAVPAGVWNSLAFWRGLTAALLCALVIGAGLVFTLARSTAPVGGAGYVAELSGSTSAVRLVAFYDSQSATLKVNRVAGVPAEGRDYQLWVIEGGNPPVSLGVLPQQAMAALRLPPQLMAKLKPDAVLAVSDEPLGGSPTGLPTGAVLATGPLSAI